MAAIIKTTNTIAFTTALDVFFLGCCGVSSIILFLFPITSYSDLKKQGIQAKVYKKPVLATHGIMITKTAMFIFECVLSVKNLLRIVFYRRTTLGVKPSFSNSLVTV
jgi:hypothetical protein